MKGNSKKEAKEKTSKRIYKEMGWIIIGIVLGIVLTPFFSPIIAHIYHSVDTEPPLIYNLTPVDNSYLFEVPIISAETVDIGGSGLNKEKSFITLTSSSQDKIKGNFSYDKNRLCFVPIVNLSPDIYTATFTVFDKANRIEEKSTRFIVLEKPKFRFDLYEQPHAYSKGDEVHNLIWKDRYIPFTFSVMNEGSNLVLENIEITYNFPGVILDNYIMADTGCINCEFKEGQSKPSIVYGGKTEINFSTCQLVLEIEKISPGGIYAGTLFIDPLYEPVDSEVMTFCEWGSNYYGSYSYSEFGKNYKEQIRGEIEVKPEVYFKKGLYFRKHGIEGKFLPDLELSAINFDKAIELGKNDSETWNERGISYFYLGNLSEAIFSFNKSIVLNPKYKESYYHIGLIYLKLGNCDKATKYAQKALSVDEDYAQAKSLINVCENQNISFIPTGFSKESLKDLNEKEGTIMFSIKESNLLNSSLKEVTVLDFTKGGSRFILLRDSDFNLIYSHISIRTGLRIAKIDLKNLLLDPEKITVALTWSPNESRLDLFDRDSKLTLSKAVQVDDKILVNALEQQAFLKLH